MIIIVKTIKIIMFIISYYEKYKTIAEIDSMLLQMAFHVLKPMVDFISHSNVQ